MDNDYIKMIKTGLVGFCLGLLVAASLINNWRLNEIQVELLTIEQLIKEANCE